jgi:hypothetical protein
MIRALLALVVGLAVVGFTAHAEDKKADAKKLEGTLCCTKCSLGETKTCGHALKVKDGDKEVTYYLNDKGGKESYHKEVCTEEKAATVTGKVSEKEGKKYIDEAKVEFKK